MEYDAKCPDTIRTHCEFHLGDNLFQLHFLRKLAEKHPGLRFVHAAHECHLPQMREVVEDMPQIELVPLLLDGSMPSPHLNQGPAARMPGQSVNAWKNTDNFFGGMEQSRDYYEFYLRWFDYHAKKLGLETPFREMTDLLFDYPALLDEKCAGLEFDTLLVNSQPCSGQWMAYDGNPAQRAVLDGIACEMAMKQRLIVTQPVEIGEIACTRRMGLSVTGIGNLSLHCRNIVMIGTGPAWPTCNIFNLLRIKKRIVMMEPERINFSPATTWHVADFGQLRAVLKEEGML